MESEQCKSAANLLIRKVLPDPESPTSITGWFSWMSTAKVLRAWTDVLVGTKSVRFVSKEAPFANLGTKTPHTETKSVDDNSVGEIKMESGNISCGNSICGKLLKFDILLASDKVRNR